MQYVRSIIPGSVSRTWNSINPATLSGAIDVIVVEQDDGSLACSPFHIRFGKFSLLRPSEKKVVFKVNGEEQSFPMKLGEGGEAFFVFETMERVPENLQTSPLASPILEPTRTRDSDGEKSNDPPLQEPDLDFDLEGKDGGAKLRDTNASGGIAIGGSPVPRSKSDVGGSIPPLSTSPYDTAEKLDNSIAKGVARKQVASLERADTDSVLPSAKNALSKALDTSEALYTGQRPPSPLRTRTDNSIRSSSPPPLSKEDAVSRAINLSKKLWTSNIPTQVTDSGDLMLDMTGYKSSDNHALRAEVIARQLLAQEIDGPYDIGALIGADEKGNLWIYSSEEAKEAAGRKAAESALGAYNPGAYLSTDALSDPGYHSDDASSQSSSQYGAQHLRRDSDSAVGLPSSPSSAGLDAAMGDPNRNYAKTLRLTSEQLKSMNLNSGANSMTFSVNKAICGATLWYWKHDVPIVISDIDGTITKSDALGHVLTMIGRDWTHQGVAKLYTDISANGYNFIYLTSRSVGQADTTRAYLDGVVQEGGYRLPKGPVILSPDRTIAALRREIYLRKPEIFKMACLRDIMALFSGRTPDTHSSQQAGLLNPAYPESPSSLGNNRGRGGSPFYAGFGNRLTDALSYRSVNIPSTRIFTINSNSEVSLDLLSLNKYKTGYASMREIVDHFFPPIGLLVKGGGEEFTDFNYWRDKPLDMVDFTDSESEASDSDHLDGGPLGASGGSGVPISTGAGAGGGSQRPTDHLRRRETVLSEDEGMTDSYYFDDAGRPSLEESVVGSPIDEATRFSLEGRPSIDDSLIFEDALEADDEGEGDYYEDGYEDEEDAGENTAILHEGETDDDQTGGVALGTALTSGTSPPLDRIPTPLN